MKLPGTVAIRDIRGMSQTTQSTPAESSQVITYGAAGGITVNRRHITRLPTLWLALRLGQLLDLTMSLRSDGWPGHTGCRLGHGGESTPTGCRGRSLRFMAADQARRTTPPSPPATTASPSARVRYPQNAGQRRFDVALLFDAP